MFIQFLLETVVAGFYLYTIVYWANMAPVGASAYFRKRGWWNRPVWESLMGENKTIVGTSAGILAGLTVAYVEHILNDWLDIPKYLKLENIYRLPWPLLGLSMSAGALVFGDMVKSIAKRHWARIEPGGPWKPWDDLDAGLGTTGVLSTFVIIGLIEPTWNLPFAAFSGVFIAYCLNPVVNRWSHRRGIKRVGH